MRFLLFLLLSISLFSNPKTLQSFLTQGTSGDYIVAKSGKLFTVIHLRSINDKTIVIEEISGPDTFVEGSWANWVKNKAPGHTSWSMLEIDLKDGQVLDCYSFSRNTRIKVSKNESILATLLQLPLRHVNDENRRRIGSPPLDGEPDFRKIWNPKLIFEGKPQESVLCDAYEATWPSDGSEFEGRQVILYFDPLNRIPFPCWIDIETSHVTGRLYVVDSGKNLISPTFKKIGK